MEVDTFSCRTRHAWAPQRSCTAAVTIAQTDLKLGRQLHRPVALPCMQCILASLTIDYLMLAYTIRHLRASQRPASKPVTSAQHNELGLDGLPAIMMDGTCVWICRW